MTLNNILVDMATRVGLYPFEWIVPDVKISGYIIPRFFGSREAGIAARRTAVTFTFDPPR